MEDALINSYMNSTQYLLCSVWLIKTKTDVLDLGNPID